jgi:hypothetical protein
MLTDTTEVNEFKIDYGPAELGGDVDDLSIPTAWLLCESLLDEVAKS